MPDFSTVYFAEVVPKAEQQGPRRSALVGSVMGFCSWPRPPAPPVGANQCCERSSVHLALIALSSNGVGRGGT
jgi:hypothetical protein